jgi:two-component system chemotaxis sensor kinase CheA
MLARAAADQLGGLAGDGVERRLDAPVRPLGGLLAAFPGVAGTTLLGDGRVLMVLDPEAVIG